MKSSSQRDHIRQRALFDDPSEGDVLFYEKELWAAGHINIAGIDEAGRGPLAGPVIAAAVVLAPRTTLDGVTDSKALTLKEREALFPLILSRARSVAVAAVWPREIDRINILEATRAAMLKAIGDLDLPVTHLLIDGNRKIETMIPQTTIVRGDARCLCISAASIVAKVVRDRLMDAMHSRWPVYRFFANRGYGTADHMKALIEHGPCPIHRFTFKPVRDAARP